MRVRRVTESVENRSYQKSSVQCLLIQSVQNNVNTFPISQYTIDITCNADMSTLEFSKTQKLCCDCDYTSCICYSTGKAFLSHPSCFYNYVVSTTSMKG